MNKIRLSTFRTPPVGKLALPSFCMIPITLLCLLFLDTISKSQATPQLPLRPSHIVVVIEENKGVNEIFQGNNAPYLKSLANQGASLTNFYALHHPSQPNYMELFSGKDQGVFNDKCPALNHGFPFSAPNLGGLLLKKGVSFAGYAEGLPSTLSNWNVLCHPTTHFAEKHCPWLDFKDVPASASKDFSQFPKDPAGFVNRLPVIAFVIPDLSHDMHGLSPNDPPEQEVVDGDAWLRENLDQYVQWAKSNNSLLIVTWDEDSSQYTYPTSPSQKITTNPELGENRIPTLVVGAMVRAGATSDQKYTHYDLLRTIEDWYGLKAIGGAANAKDITGIWN